MNLDRFGLPGPADEPIVVGDCAHCGGEIYEGDEVVRDIDGNDVHAECWRDYAAITLRERAGAIDRYGRII